MSLSWSHYCMSWSVKWVPLSYLPIAPYMELWPEQSLTNGYLIGSFVGKDLHQASNCVHRSQCIFGFFLYWERANIVYLPSLKRGITSLIVALSGIQWSWVQLEQANQFWHVDTTSDIFMGSPQCVKGTHVVFWSVCFNLSCSQVAIFYAGAFFSPPPFFLTIGQIYNFLGIGEGNA